MYRNEQVRHAAERPARMSGQAFKDFLHNVRTAEKWDRLRAMLTPQDTVGIIIYGEPDPDSLASGWALMHLLKPRVHSVRLIATQPVRREENARFLTLLRIPLEVVAEIPCAAFTKTAIVDAQPDFFQPCTNFPFDIVIDHHPKRAQYSFKFMDIRPRYGATATMMLEYLLWSGVRITKQLATALLFGIRIDTDHLERSVHNADLAAYCYLYRLSNRRMIQWLEHSIIPAAYKELFARGLHALDTHQPQGIVMLGEVPQPDACVHVADFLTRFGSSQFIAVAGISAGILYVILRSGNYGTNVGRIARLRLSTFGSAGGRQDKARAEIQMKRISAVLGIAHPSHERIEQWLKSILARGKKWT